MQNVFKKSIVVILLGLLLFGAGAVSAQDDGGAGPDSPSVVVIADEGGDESLLFIVIVALGVAGGVVLQGVFGQRGLELALQTGGMVAGRTKSPDDDKWLIEVAMNFGYVPTKQADGTITFEKKEPRPDDANGGA